MLSILAPGPEPRVPVDACVSAALPQGPADEQPCRISARLSSDRFAPLQLGPHMSGSSLLCRLSGMPVVDYSKAQAHKARGSKTPWKRMLSHPAVWAIVVRPRVQ